jgi:hypothetical protein
MKRNWLKNVYLLYIGILLNLPCCSVMTVSSENVVIKKNIAAKKEMFPKLDMQVTGFPIPLDIPDSDSPACFYQQWLRSSELCFVNIQLPESFMIIAENSSGSVFKKIFRKKKNDYRVYTHQPSASLGNTLLKRPVTAISFRHYPFFTGNRWKISCYDEAGTRILFSGECMIYSNGGFVLSSVPLSSPFDSAQTTCSIGALLNIYGKSDPGEDIRFCIYNDVTDKKGSRIKPIWIVPNIIKADVQGLFSLTFKIPAELKADSFYYLVISEKGVIDRESTLHSVFYLQGRYNK